MSVATTCSLFSLFSALPLLQSNWRNIMKLITTSFFVFILSAPFVAADGCGKHGEDVTMSCAVGQIWNPETQQCMDTNA